MVDVLYWMWLSLSVTPGSTTFAKLVKEYPSPREIYDLGESDYIKLLSSRCSDIATLCNKDLERAENILSFCNSKKIGILLYCDAAYPKSLKAISNPPVLLYYRGVLPDFNSECFISVVGTRSLTDYGRRNAFTISYDLARTGAIVVSGMAKGIDGVSHAGALAAGAVTVAVLGSGIDVCYPQEHKRLAQTIVKRGCVLTEYPPKSSPQANNFPRRNRIISGLSYATVVIEGVEKSGALITARCAKTQNRLVYALPGNVDNKTSQVSNLLIKNGAKLITRADDIIADVEFAFPGKINPFILMENKNVRMNDVLRHLSICCVAPSDKVFSPFPSRKASKKDIKPASEQSYNDTNSREQEKLINEQKEAQLLSFDKAMLAIYKKIPTEGDCSVEAICTDEYPLKDVMRILTKLEMQKFVIMLPSGRVKRNLT